MSEFIVKTEKEWKHINEALPEIGKTIEVLCTMITKASLNSCDPVQWEQKQDITEAYTEVKLWREIDDELPK